MPSKPKSNYSISLSADELNALVRLALRPDDKSTSSIQTVEGKKVAEILNTPNAGGALNAYEILADSLRKWVGSSDKKVIGGVEKETPKIYVVSLTREKVSVSDNVSKRSSMLKSHRLAAKRRQEAAQNSDVRLNKAIA